MIVLPLLRRACPALDAGGIEGDFGSFVSHLQGGRVTEKLPKDRHWLYLLSAGIALVVLWRGVWGLLDLYLFPDDPLLSYLTSFVVGLALLYFNDRSLDELL